MKTYIIPATMVVRIEANQMLAASGDKLYDFDSNGGKGKLVDGDATGEALTRQHHGIGGGLWEDMK